jgi:hypothetical protein
LFDIEQTPQDLICKLDVVKKMQRQNLASFIRLSRALLLSLLVVMSGGLLEPEAAGQSVSFGPKTHFDTGAVQHQLRSLASCGLRPDCGEACVSHLTGSRTTDSAAACCAFHSLIASDAGCRSSAKSDGEAISTRYVIELNDNWS